MTNTDIDTDIRHVTPAGANLFLELGFSAEEAECLRLQATSCQQIEDTLSAPLSLRRLPPS